MPIYEYELVDGSCSVCGGHFELRRPVNRPPLEKCPLCKKPVRRVISKVHTPRILKPISPAEARNAGFTVFKRRDKGVYEQL
jgi:putative FmdB family regulatory protein